jgi:hypothetical protein
MAKRTPKFEVGFSERLKQRDIARGVIPPDNKTKGFRNNKFKQYLVIPPINDDREIPSHHLYVYHRLTGKILWLKHHEVVEKKLMGYTIEPYDIEKHWSYFYER